MTSTAESATLIGGLVALGPLLLLLSGLAPRTWANRHPAAMGRIAGGLAWIAFGAAVLAACAFIGRDEGALESGFSGLNLYYDSLSATLLLLVSFLGAVVIRYSRHYLDGDAEQGRFLKWMSCTVGWVLLLIVSGNLVLFTLAWMATSLSLHQLLTFYSDRPAALLAARKKFIISRIGDLSLIGAMLLIYRSFGSLDFAEIFDIADSLHRAGVEEALSWGGPALPWVGFLLVLGALLKSAQFPFHSWLPEVMETPTPVSALLHAGIINAGGFLIVRMSHVLALAPAALNVLAVLGAATALFGSVAMLTQTSIKKSLAYSTVGQMGFMMLQCGLGAFSAAILHIVSHSLYKAHAFLASGSIVDIARASWVPTARKDPHPLHLLASIALAVALTFAVGTAFGISLLREPGVLVLGATLQIALAYLLWNSCEGRFSLPVAAWGLAMALLVCLAYFTLQSAFAHLLRDALPEPLADRGWFDALLTLMVLASFTTVLLLQTRFPDRAGSRIWQAAYVHVHNGFYVGTLANRLIRRYWRIHAKHSS